MLLCLQSKANFFGGGDILGVPVGVVALHYVYFTRREQIHEAQRTVEEALS